MATAKKVVAKKAAPTTVVKTAVKKTVTRRSATPDAFELLIRDHKEAKTLFRKYERLCKADASSGEKQAVANEVCMKLTVHARIEEEIFYPAARADKTDDLLDEAEVEHASAKDLIAQIEGMSPEDDLYDAKVTVLGKYIEHHVQEEEGEMFRKIKALKLDLAGLGTQLLARKQELLSEMAAV